MRRLSKLVVLDRIILLKRQWDQLRSLAGQVVEYAGLDEREIIKRLQQEADTAEAPMCWTQLAQEELTVREINDRVAGADGVITCWTNIPDAVLRANPSLRYVGFWTNLVDHRISRKVAEELGIAVDFVPDYGTDSVAEMTILGMLAVSRELLVSARDTKRGSWAYELLKAGKRVPTIDQIPQRMLKGKRLGLVGFGRIGQRVAELGLAFGMNVQYWSQRPRDEWTARNVHWATLRDVFSGSDIVSIHLSPYAPAKMVTAALLRSLPDGAIFVNTSAGRLVDQEALWLELKSGRVYAYVDVYDSLPPRKTISELLGKNVFTYRAGWFTQEAVTYKGDALIANLERFLTASGDAGHGRSGLA